MIRKMGSTYPAVNSQGLVSEEQKMDAANWGLVHGMYAKSYFGEDTSSEWKQAAWTACMEPETKMHLESIPSDASSSLPASRRTHES